MEFSLVGPIRRISYLIMTDSYSKCFEIIPIKSAKIGTVINSLCQIFANKGMPKVVESINITQFSSTRFEDFCCCLNISLLHSPPILNGLGEQLIDNVKRQLLMSQV